MAASNRNNLASRGPIIGSIILKFGDNAVATLPLRGENNPAARYALRENNPRGLTLSAEKPRFYFRPAAADAGGKPPAIRPLKNGSSKRSIDLIANAASIPLLMFDFSVFQACAPRYVWFTYQMNMREPVGTCFVVRNNFRQNLEFSPCRTSKYPSFFELGREGLRGPIAHVEHHLVGVFTRLPFVSAASAYENSEPNPVASGGVCEEPG